MRKIYTDGAASGNGTATARGGWAWIAVEDEREIARDSGGALGATNNSMEITAVIEGLRAAPSDCVVEVISDSAYVINCLTRRWHEKWTQNGWRNANRKPVANRALWEALLAAVAARTAETRWTHMKGHTGHRWNDAVDALAVDATAHVTEYAPSSTSSGLHVQRDTVIEQVRSALEAARESLAVAYGLLERLDANDHLEAGE